MALPINLPHPVTENPSVARADAALPGAGAWDAAPVEISVAGFRKVSLFLAYTRGAAGGAFDFRLELAPRAVDVALVEDWFTQAAYMAGALAAGADTQSRIQREYITYASQGAAVETFIYGPLELGGAIERVRIPARESGVVGTPGNLAVYAVLYE